MGLDTLARGIVIGFSIAAPVGPIGVLCIRRTLADGRTVGLATGLGAATADACYSAVAALGITLIAHLLLGYQGVIRVIGGLFLCFLGLRTFVTAPGERSARMAGRTVRQAYLSAVVLTLTNPTTILSFVAIFAGVGAGGGDSGKAMLLVLGVFAGSALWWVLLSSSVAVIRTRVGPRLLQWVNRFSGMVLIAFGLLALASLRT